MEHLIRKERKKEAEKERKREAKRERVTCKLDEGGSSKIGKKRPSLRTEERERDDGGARFRRARKLFESLKVAETLRKTSTGDAEVGWAPTDPSGTL